MSRIQDDSLRGSVAHAVVRLFREQNRLHGRVVQPFGVSTEQAHLLVVLWAAGPLTMKELGEEVALSSGTLSTAVDRMEASGLVTRAPDPVDRRAVRVEAVAWPKAKRERLLATLVETEHVMLAPLTAAEQKTLHGLLGRVIEGFSPKKKR